jgi:uncharacterized protein YndB with AHSA1/START domain
MSEVVTSIDIDAPPEEVWRVVMDPQRLEEWVTIHTQLKRASGDARKGATMEQTLSLRGVHFDVDWKLEASDAPRHAKWRGKGPARSRAETEYRLTPRGNAGTRFDYRNEFKAPLGALGALASRALVGGIPKREADASLRKLKALVEDGRG